MQTCKTCRFWDGKYCGRVFTSQDSPPSVEMVQIVVKVADDYNLEVDLQTHPNFGCVLHETRSSMPIRTTGENMTEQMTELEITKAIEATSDQLHNLDQIINEKIREARQKIQDYYSQERTALSNREYDLREKLDELKIANNANNPLIGKKVYKTERKRIGGGLHKKEVSVFGVIEQRTNETVFASNVSNFMKPRIGRLFVRLIKANGQVGKNFESYHESWKLCEQSETK